MTNIRKVCEKNGRITADSTGHWTFARLRFINNFLGDNYALRAHAELLNNDFPLHEGRPEGLKSITQLRSTCPSLWNEEISTASAGNLTLDEGSGGMKMKQPLTKEQIIKCIKNFAIMDRKLLNHKLLIRNGKQTVVYYALKYFGTWHKAILASGEKPLYQKWNKDKVVFVLKKIHEETGKVPNYGELERNGRGGLLKATRKYYGSWVNAIHALGLRPKRNDYWTKESLIQELKKVVSQIGHTPSKRELRKLKREDLVSSGSKFFGSYNNFVIDAGFKPVLIPNIWTKERITEELRQVALELGRTPTERDMIAIGKRTVIMATWTQFRGWNKAIEEAGLRPNGSFVSDKTWKLWEQFALELCEELYLDSETHKILPNGTIPDFYEYSENMIIEIKTNASDTTIIEDVRKYEPYCDRIEIWYLTGKPATSLSSKIVFRGPEYVISIIKEHKETLEQFKEIMKRFEQNGTETQKGLDTWFGTN